MSDIAIRVEKLGKTYRIGGRQARHDRLTERLMDAVSAPVRRLRNLGKPAPAEEIIWALKDVSFEVRPGEVVGIIGRNGAGKSTLLKILSRITEPTEGHVEIRGRVGSLLEVGTGFHPDLTGRENVYLNGAILGMRRGEIERKFDEIVDFSGVEKFIDTPVKRYSSGMRVRLGFAVAAHLDPEILLVDEVLAVGDVAFQKKCLGKMGSVARQGRTVLFVSHNMAAIIALCHRGILIDGGSVAMSGPSGDVVTRYLMADATLGGEVTLPPATGDARKAFGFRSIRVLVPGGSVSGQIPLSDGADVELEYEVRSVLEGANVAVYLTNALGICVLCTTDVDTSLAGAPNTRTPGVYRARLHIPSQYFRPGTYYLDVTSSIPRGGVLAYLPRVLAFEVVDTGSVETRTGRRRTGIVAPILDWRTQQVGYHEVDPTRV